MVQRFLWRIGMSEGVTLRSLERIGAETSSKEAFLRAWKLVANAKTDVYDEEDFRFVIELLREGVWIWSWDW
jgi:hypothetical protein